MRAARVSVETIGRRYVDAFNRRDIEGLVALSHSAIEFRPTMLVGARRRYDGHEGLRRWFEEMGGSEIEIQIRVSEVRALGDDGFLVLSEILLDDKLVSPAAMLARLAGDGRIIEARSFLTDEEMLRQVGWAPDPSPEDE
jgi:SnoaL-like protein